MKNKEKYDLNTLKVKWTPQTAERRFFAIKLKSRLDSNITYVEIEYNGKLVKEYACTNEAGIKKFLEWLEEEYKPPILDDVEKAYLSAVIKPFRKDIEYIVKFKRYSDKKEYIYMTMKKDDDYCTLPVFEKGTMYKGMELNKRYTLEELGL